MTAALNSPLDHALDLARRGFWLFPLKPGRKLPAHTGWQDEATRDETRITKWFAKRPFNLGIFTGKFQDDKALVVVDVDTKNGKRGYESLLALEMAGNDLPLTLKHCTCSGAEHLIYVWDDALKGGTDKLGNGLDVKSQGGLIVAPGSQVNGEPYVRLNNLEPALAPAWLVQRLGVGREKAGPAEGNPPASVDPARARARAMDFLKTAPVAVEHEGGDTLTFRTAATLKDLGCSQADALDLLLEHWNERCDPPWEPEDLALKVHNAFAHGKDAPGCDAPEAIFDAVPVVEGEAAPVKPKPRALEVLRWRDFKDKDVPPVQWILEPYFPSVPFGILASHPGHGKSFLALQIAVAVAVGLPLFGLPTSGPAGAGVLALEDGENTVMRRLKAIVDAYGFEWTPKHDDLLDRNLVLMVRGRTALEGLGSAAAAHALAKLAHELVEDMRATLDPPAVLFLDTLNAIYDGDEKDNTAFRLMASTIFGLHDALDGCSIWALHHLKKAGAGRNAPALADRQDPELVRGASAIAGSARAMVQFGWITPSEATKAGLEAENSQRHYAVMGLTKINDGPLSPRLLLEHAKGSGLWLPTVEGDHALAMLQGAGAVEELGQAEGILLDLHAGMDRQALAGKYFPDDPKGPGGLLKGVLQKLRGRKGWLIKGGIELTANGLKKVMELKGIQSSDGGYLEGHEITESQ